MHGFIHDEGCSRDVGGCSCAPARWVAQFHGQEKLPSCSLIVNAAHTEASLIQPLDPAACVCWAGRRALRLCALACVNYNHICWVTSQALGALLSGMPLALFWGQIERELVFCL